MTVAELIKFLQTQPQDLPVAYRLYSEQKLLETAEIKIDEFCKARPDDYWVENKRPDKPSIKYLVFPGN